MQDGRVAAAEQLSRLEGEVRELTLQRNTARSEARVGPRREGRSRVSKLFQKGTASRYRQNSQSYS